MTLGHNPWCTSVWQPVYYRVWHTHPGVAPPKLLLDGTDDSFIDELTGARVSGDDVLFEYAVSGIPAGDRLAEIRHYLFREGKLERVNPVALTPRDFVAFWLVRPWSETAAWAEKSNRLKLQAWRQQHQEGGNWFDDRATLQCKTHPNLWQVSLPHSPNPIYALIRWLPPHRLTMVDIGDHPWPDCTMADPDADQPLYLFPYR